MTNRIVHAFGTLLGAIMVGATWLWLLHYAGAF